MSRRINYFPILTLTGVLLVEVVNNAQIIRFPLVPSSSSSADASRTAALQIPPSPYSVHYATTMKTNSSLFHGVHARAFPKWEQPNVPCYPPTSKNGNIRKATKRGLLFLKLHKVGSSTAAGINAQIARNEAARRRNLNETSSRIEFEGNCEAQLAHAKAKNLCPHRIRKKSFLWTIVRDPTR